METNIVAYVPVVIESGEFGGFDGVYSSNPYSFRHSGFRIRHFSVRRRAVDLPALVLFVGYVDRQTR